MSRASIKDVTELESLLSEPLPEVVESVSRLQGDIILLGAAGKMGPGLACMARRASDAAGVRRRVIGVSRFSSDAQEAALQAHGISTIRCDLLDEQQVAALPDSPNVIYLAGMKFGATGQEALTWAMNAHLPSIICKKFRNSKIVAFSTGNVYGLTQISGGGSREEDVPNPVGEYAMSCLGRERLFEHFSRELRIPIALLRLNYACDIRYGVLIDLAQRVWSGQPIDLAMAYFNTIWQGDANAMTLRAFDHVCVPARIINVTGPELLRVRDVCEQLGRRMGRAPVLIGTEADTALLSDVRRGIELLGPTRVPAGQLVDWAADWVMRGGPTLGKPTRFESRDGRF